MIADTRADMKQRRKAILTSHSKAAEILLKYRQAGRTRSPFCCAASTLRHCHVISMLNHCQIRISKNTPLQLRR